jgi:3-vinyl bacteriochlorophyllide hydratase
MGLPRQPSGHTALYSAEQRIRRDSSKWTLVQGVLAAFQFLVFAVSLVLVMHTLLTGEAAFAANVSVVFKTLILCTIMITGSLWEKDVFGQYLFAPAFFWEDAVSFVVIALHLAYVVALFASALEQRDLMLLALSAYATYAVNAAQFLWKLKLARAGQANTSHVEVQA